MALWRVSLPPDKGSPSACARLHPHRDTAVSCPSPPRPGGPHPGCSCVPGLGTDKTVPTQASNWPRPHRTVNPRWCPHRGVCSHTTITMITMMKMMIIISATAFGKKKIPPLKFLDCPCFVAVCLQAHGVPKPEAALSLYDAWIWPEVQGVKTKYVGQSDGLHTSSVQHGRPLATCVMGPKKYTKKCVRRACPASPRCLLQGSSSSWPDSMPPSLQNPAKPCKTLPACCLGRARWPVPARDCIFL